MIQPALCCSDPSSTARLKEGCLIELNLPVWAGSTVHLFPTRCDSEGCDAEHREPLWLSGRWWGPWNPRTDLEIPSTRAQSLRNCWWNSAWKNNGFLRSVKGAFVRLELSILACEFCTLLGHTSSWSPGRRRLRLCSGSPEVSGDQQPNAADAQRPAHTLMINTATAWWRPLYSNFGSSRLQLTSFCLEGSVEFLWE